MLRAKTTALAIAVLVSTIGCGTRVERAAVAPVGAPTVATPSSVDVTPGTHPSPGAALEQEPGSAITAPAPVASGQAPKASPAVAAGAEPAVRSAPVSRAPGAAAASADPAETAQGERATLPGPGPPGAGGEPISIGSVGVLSGPLGTNLKPISDSLRIWVRWFNDAGGLNGRPVRLFLADTAGDPARNRALVQQMVEERNVVAFVAQPGDAFGGEASVAYLTERGVPVIGSEGAAQWFYESPVYFPQIMHGRPLIQAIAVGMADAGVARQKSKLALWTCVEAQMCRDMESVIPKTTGPRGLRVVHQAKISIGQPDFTAECLNARNAGAELIFPAADGASVSRAAASCARQGYRPTWVISGQQIQAQQHGADPNFEQAIGVDTQAPWFLDNTPGRRQFRDAMARYAPNAVVTTSNMVGWIGGRLFEIAARAAPQPLTRAGLLASLGSIQGDPLPDLTVPYHFNPGRPATPTMCYWLESPVRGKWTSPDGGQRHCSDYVP